MPNWVHNSIFIKNTFPEFEEIKRKFEAAKSNDDQLFQEIHPMPNELDETRIFVERLIFKGLSFSEHIDISKIDPMERARKEIEFSKYDRSKEEARIIANNLSKYGAKDWYEWCITNWGCKWDATDLSVSCEDGQDLCADFQTPYEWPTGVYERLTSLYPQIQLLVFSWEFENNYRKGAVFTPSEGWLIEDLGGLYDANHETNNTEPSDQFLDAMKAFNVSISSIFPECRCIDSENECYELPF